MVKNMYHRVIHAVIMVEDEAYTDDKCTDESSWQSHLVSVGHKTASNNGGSIAGKGELQRGRMHKGWKTSTNQNTVFTHPIGCIHNA